MTRIAQLLLVVAGVALYAGSRMAWVVVSSFDGLGQPKSTTLNGGAWSTALVPLALLVLAAAVAALAVRGWALRLLALLLAVASAGMGYLAIGLWVIRDDAVRAVDLAQIPITALVDTQRHYGGAVLVLVAAVCTLIGAVLLVRTAATSGTEKGRRTDRSSGKYLAPAARREAVRNDAPEDAMSERMIWDALDEGLDPTRDSVRDTTKDGPAPENEGR